MAVLTYYLLEPGPSPGTKRQIGPILRAGCSWQVCRLSEAGVCLLPGKFCSWPAISQSLSVFTDHTLFSQ